MSLTDFVPWYWRLLGVLGLVLAASICSAVLAVRYEQGQQAEAQVARELATITSMKHGDQEAADYAKRIERLARDVPAAGARLERLCGGRILHGTGDVDAAAAAHAGDRPADLAVDLIACEANADQLRTLQAVIRPQLR